VTRILTFDGPRGSKRFELLYTALMSAGDGKGDRSSATIRKEARLFDLLDEVSEVNPDAIQGNVDRRLSTAPVSIAIPQEDHELLVKYAEATPWAPRASREAVDLWDWLSAAERRD
jgi:hypothetical protein